MPADATTGWSLVHAVSKTEVILSEAAVVDTGRRHWMAAAARSRVGEQGAVCTQYAESTTSSRKRHLTTKPLMCRSMNIDCEL